MESFFLETQVYSTICKRAAAQVSWFSTRKAVDLNYDLERLVDGTPNTLNPILQVFGSVSDKEMYAYKYIMRQTDYWTSLEKS